MAVALALLGRRDRTTAELTLALQKSGYDAPDVSEALRRLTELGYLDDARFAKSRAALLLQEGKHGVERVRAQLLAQGVSPELAAEGLALAEEELGISPLEAARALLVKRGLLHGMEPRVRAKAARFLSGRGFPESVVEQLVGDSALSMTGQDE